MHPLDLRGKRSLISAINSRRSKRRNGRICAVAGTGRPDGPGASFTVTKRNSARHNAWPALRDARCLQLDARRQPIQAAFTFTGTRCLTRDRLQLFFLPSRARLFLLLEPQSSHAARGPTAGGGVDGLLLPTVQPDTEEFLDVVKLHFAGGVLLLPSRTPYEREVLFESIAFYARRHGGAELELRKLPQRVTAVRAAADDHCGSCGQRIFGIVFVLAELRRCQRCFDIFRPTMRARSRAKHSGTGTARWRRGAMRA